MSESNSAGVTDPVQQQNPSPNPNPEQPTPARVFTPEELSQGFLQHADLFRQLKRHMAQVDDKLNQVSGAVNELILRTAGPQPNPQTGTSKAVNSEDRLPGTVKLPMPDDFRGDKDQLVHWLSTMERILDIVKFDLNTDLSVAYASLFFKGKVKTWWASECKRTNDFKCAGYANFSQLSQALKDFLEDPYTMERAMDKLRKLKQEGSVFDYATKFFDLLHQIPHRAEQDAVYDFVRGLKGFHHQFVSQLKPTNLQQAREYALRADDTWLHNRNHSSSAATYYPKASSSASPMDLSVLSHSRGRSSTRGRSEVRGRTATPGPSYKASSRSRSGSRSSRSPSASFNALTVKELCTEPFKKLTPEDSKLLTSQRICTFCRKPNHTVHECPKRARYNSTKHTSSSRQGK